MEQGTSDTGRPPKRGRVILIVVVVLVAAFAVWKVIDYRSQPQRVVFTPTPDGLEALRYLAEAKTSTNAAGSDFDKAGIFAEIAAAQARAGDLPAAWATTNEITKQVAKSNAVISISAAQIERGDLAGAQSTVKGLQGITPFIGGSWGAVALRQAKGGDIASARATASIIENDSSKAWTLSKIAIAQARAGDVAGAEATAKAITEDLPKVEAFGEIAVAQTRAGDKDNANQTFARAEAMANAVKDELDRNSALLRLAATQTSAGNVAKARLIVRDMTSLDNWRALRAIAKAQARTGDITGAKATANEIADNNYKATTLSDVALAQGSKGDRAGATQTLFEAKAARNLPGTKPDKGTLCEIAAVQAKVGDITAAQATMNSVTEDDFKSIGFAAIAIAQAKAGDVAGAKATINALQKDALGEYPWYSALIAIMAAQARAEGFPTTERWVQTLAEPKTRTLYYVALAEARLNPNAAASDESEAED